MHGRAAGGAGPPGSASPVSAAVARGQAVGGSRALAHDRHPRERKIGRSRQMLRGMMMERPLLVSSLIAYGAELHPDVPIVSAAVEGGIHRTTFAATYQRIARLANALRDMGVKPGDRI